MKIVVVGHVDHGKSTLTARLLVDTQSIPEEKIKHIKEYCDKNSKPFEYAYLIDALKEEQQKGITIDTAHCSFSSAKRQYKLLDAPGHTEFTKNMVTGAANAEAAFLVVDAEKGIEENSRRHGYLLSMLGVEQIIVLVNKMDLVNYNEHSFLEIVNKYKQFLNEIKVKPLAFIPVSGFYGDNVVEESKKMLWYKGKTMVEQLDELINKTLPALKPLRLPIQDAYRFDGDDRTIIAGTINSGSLTVGDEVSFYPSGIKTVVKSIESYNTSPLNILTSEHACGITVMHNTAITRGEIVVKNCELKPHVSNEFIASIFWLGKKPLVKGKEYYLKLGTAKVKMHVKKICRVLDTAELSYSTNEIVNKNEAAECILKLQKPIAFDLVSDIVETSRFVIVDDYEISGGGIVKACED